MVYRKLDCFHLFFLCVLLVWGVWIWTRSLFLISSYASTTIMVWLLSSPYCPDMTFGPIDPREEASIRAYLASAEARGNSRSASTIPGKEEGPDPDAVTPGHVFVRDFCREDRDRQREERALVARVRAGLGQRSLRTEASSDDRGEDHEGPDPVEQEEDKHELEGKEKEEEEAAGKRRLVSYLYYFISLLLILSLSRFSTTISSSCLDQGPFVEVRSRAGGEPTAHPEGRLRAHPQHSQRVRLHLFLR